MSKEEWEIKDRKYMLKHMTPLTYRLPSKHTRRCPLLWFNEETGENKEIRYATNQNSPFTEEQNGTCTLGHIVFRKGILFVSKRNQALQKLLSLYHPHKDKIYYEWDPVEVATDEVVDIEIKIDALNLAREMDIDEAEAILRVEMGSAVRTMSSKELKRDLMLFAEKNPTLFIELANDENVQLRNFGIIACEKDIIKLSQDQRTFSWASNGRKLLNVPFEENPYSALAAWFKTDEGVEVYKSIEKKLK
tara:strand:- start:1060 stop:1803 length:744 start_codon:yes stop_codon:yes gene_type:complete